jgi:hypothetical protein
MVSLNLGPEKGQRIGVRRRRPVRPKTVSLRSLTRERRSLPILGAGGADGADDADEAALPLSRQECRGGIRPCPFVSCRFHLYLDVNEDTGSIKINFPDKEPWELTCSCALDVAEGGGLTLEDVGSLLNLTRERARQVESVALQKIHDVLGQD